MGSVYGSVDWREVAVAVTKDIQLEFREDVPITPSLEEGGQSGKPYRVGFRILASRQLHLSISFELQKVGFTNKNSLVRQLTFYAVLTHPVPHKLELGNGGWVMTPAEDSPAIEKLSSNPDLYKRCFAFAGGKYEVHTSKAFSKRWISVEKIFQIVPYESSSMIITSTLPTDAGGLLKVSEFIEIADAIEQVL
jgi:hypothetical protein